MADAIKPALPGRRVVARIELAADVAARLPPTQGVVSVGRLTGWAVRAIDEMLVRVRGAVVRAVTSRDLRQRELQTLLEARLEEGKSSVGAGRRAVSDVAKAWAIEYRRDPEALEALCRNADVQLDGALVSSLVDSCAAFGEMGHSRVFGAMTRKVLFWDHALRHPDSVSKVLAAAAALPWAAPAHEAVAGLTARLDRDLFYEASTDDRTCLESAIGTPLEAVMAEYVKHPRVAVVAELARRCDRSNLLREMSGRAQDLYALDPRLAYRLVETLAHNGSTPPESLQVFARADIWTDGSAERKALDALLQRGVPARTADSYRPTGA